MKIRVTLTVEVDEQAWRETYGLLPDEDVRADVRGYIEGLVNEQLDMVGVNAIQRARAPL